MLQFFKKNKPKQEALDIPKHIGIIMDGNGRWAKRKALPRSVGHHAGANTLKKIVRYCDKIGVEYLTVYAFSTENWIRPQQEVDSIMSLLLEYLLDFKNQLDGDLVVIHVIGDRTPFTDEIKKAMQTVEDYTKNNTGIVLNIALNYGGRSEIVNAAKTLAEMVQKGEITPKEIDEQKMNQLMETKDCAEVDLIIRPSGEKRLSNFLLWQAAYAELWYDEICWPDFKTSDLDRAILDFNKRNRRYGGV